MPILPQRLKKGDTIGIISPAGAIKDCEAADLVRNYFVSKGYNTKIAPHACDKKTYLAGEDKYRLSDLMDFFADAQIKAIICFRGGYGTFRLLEKIDWELIQKNPKIFVGYSDITSLLNNFVQKSGVICFHGPMGLPDFGISQPDKHTEENFWNIIEGKLKIPYSYENIIDYQCINPGKTEGILMGGNLSILCGLLGTDYFPDLDSKILLLEDVGEPLYKIDRMLMQLKLAGVLDKVSGVLFAEFTSVTESGDPEVNKLTPLDIIKELFDEFNIPIGYGFPASHSTVKNTLPLGVKYYFNSEEFKLEIIEDYLSE